MHCGLRTLWVFPKLYTPQPPNLELKTLAAPGPIPRGSLFRRYFLQLTVWPTAVPGFVSMPGFKLYDQLISNQTALATYV